MAPGGIAVTTNDRAIPGIMNSMYLALPSGDANALELASLLDEPFPWQE